MRTSAAAVLGVVFGGLALSCHSADKDPVSALNTTRFSASQRASGSAAHVRWDIVSLNFSTTPPTVSAGGVAFASARNPSTLTIRLTGSGTFFAPASGGPSGAVRGGGTWETFSGTTSTGSGTYVVKRLVSWEFANSQTPGSLNDNIGNQAQTANGTAVVRIEYSDGSDGSLGIGCHGPGAPGGIVEGVIATKGFVTYWDAGAPAGGVDKNRTLFHVKHDDDDDDADGR
jgi:hypothetical protein